MKTATVMRDMRVSAPGLNFINAISSVLRGDFLSAGINCRIAAREFKSSGNETDRKLSKDSANEAYDLFMKVADRQYDPSIGSMYRYIGYVEAAVTAQEFPEALAPERKTFAAKKAVSYLIRSEDKDGSPKDLARAFSIADRFGVDVDEAF